MREISSCSCLTVLPGPVWLLLNKIYIPLFRALYSQVDAAEGRDLSLRHDAFAFHEVSVADQPSATVDVMNSMVAEIWKEKVNERTRERSK